MITNTGYSVSHLAHLTVVIVASVRVRRQHLRHGKRRTGVIKAGDVVDMNMPKVGAMPTAERPKGKTNATRRAIST
jgi:hypothetical protein